jgi:hypothetical protein
MTYCGIHGIEHKDYTDCPRCLADQRHHEALEQSQRHHEETLEATRQTAYDSDRARADFGDYTCPHCRYVTLRMSATRCPSCHGSIEPSFWVPILEQQKRSTELARVRAEEAEAERARMAPIIAARQAQEQKESRRLQRRRVAAVRWRMLWKVYFFYLLPVLTIFSAVLVLFVPTGSSGIPPDFSVTEWLSEEASILLLPVVNWMVCLGALVEGESRLAIAGCLAAWSVVGALGHRHTTRVG